MVGFSASAFRFQILRLRFSASIETRLLQNGVGAHFIALRPMATLSSWCWLPTSLPRSWRTNSSSFPLGSAAWFFAFECSPLNPSAPCAWVVSCVLAGLTLRSTRTPPALPFALSQLLAISASFVASVQAGPVNSRSSLWGWQHGFPFPHNRPRIQASRVLGREKPSARPNR